MTIQDNINNDLKDAINNRDNELRDNLKVLVSELQRQKTKVLSDESSVEILRVLAKWEAERLEKIGEEKSDYLNLINKYIPEQVSDEIIEGWINENIDLSQFKYKLAATKLVLNNFGIYTSRDQVKSVLTRM